MSSSGSMMKIDSQQVTSAIMIMLLGWGAFQLYSMNANLAVVSYKVDENYNMIKPMWQDFLVRSANYDQSGTNAVSNIQVTRGKD
jgi:hypothetical protein